MLPAQSLREAIAREWMVAGPWRIPAESVQPASVDLRLGEHAWALRCSFLPDSDSTVEQKIEDIAFQRIDLRDGATLERDRPYLVPLIEELRLPDDIRAKANPKSSTGRLDVFTRVLTDRSHRFDEIARRLSGQAVPGGGAAHVRHPRADRPGAQPGPADVRQCAPRTTTSCSRCTRSRPCCTWTPSRCAHPSCRSLTGCSSASTCPAQPTASSATAPRRTAFRSTSAAWARCKWRDYWEAVHPEKGRRIVLEPEVFYLLLSAEGVSIPPSYAAEMLAYDPTAGELRTHYAGFFDPGFGYSADPSARGSRAALEVRARDVSFMVEHRQPVCKLAFERMAEQPDVLYGKDIGSNYQGQVTMLSKHFVEQGAQGRE